MQKLRDNETRTRVIAYSLTDDEAEDTPVRYKKKVMRPDLLSMKLRWVHGDTWELESVVISGRRILKDGLSEHRESDRWSYDLARLPDWAQPLVSRVMRQVNP